MDIDKGRIWSFITMMRFPCIILSKRISGWVKNIGSNRRGLTQDLGVGPETNFYISWDFLLKNKLFNRKLTY